MTPADQLTLARVAAVPIVVTLFVWDFQGHYWWATGVFITAMTTDWFDGQVARRSGYSSPLGSVAWWALLIALVLTWFSGLDYARVAPGLLRGRTASP